MSKKTGTSKINRRVKEGQGSRIGSDYKPWLNNQDVSSLGHLTRLNRRDEENIQQFKDYIQKEL